MKHEPNEPKTSLYRGIDGERLYTAADLKAARLETVERCLVAVILAWAEGPVTRAKCVEVFKKLKEEIENEL